MIKKYLFINFLIWFNFIGVDDTAQQPFPPCAVDQKLDKCFGRQVFPDGEYVGDLVNGLREGKGTLINGAIFRYDGDFKNGLFHGEGRTNIGMEFNSLANSRKASGSQETVGTCEDNLSFQVIYLHNRRLCFRRKMRVL